MGLLFRYTNKTHHIRKINVLPRYQVRNALRPPMFGNIWMAKPLISVAASLIKNRWILDGRSAHKIPVYLETTDGCRNTAYSNKLSLTTQFSRIVETSPLIRMVFEKKYNVRQSINFVVDEKEEMITHTAKQNESQMDGGFKKA